MWPAAILFTADQGLMGYTVGRSGQYWILERASVVVLVVDGSSRSVDSSYNIHIEYLTPHDSSIHGIFQDKCLERKQKGYTILCGYDVVK